MPEAAGSRQQIRFGIFEVDLRAGELRKSGTKIRLEGQPFELLALLLERPGEVATRDEIRQRLWPSGTYVDYEHSINAAVKRLREVLDDSAESPRFVETLPRRGYRFIYPVQDEVVPPAPTRRGYRRGGAVLVLLAIAVLLGGVVQVAMRWSSRQTGTKVYAIAVLPVRNQTGDPGQDYLADAATDLLTGRLAQVQGLQVPSVTSAMAIKNPPRSMKEIAGQLHVQAVVEASVQRRADRFVMVVQLIDATHDTHLGSNEYEFEPSGIHSVLGTIATGVLARLPVALTAEERSRVARVRTTSVEANEAFLKGKYHLRRGTQTDRVKAASYFETAIAADDAFAPAYSSLALLHAHGGGYLAGGRMEARVKARQWVTRALELDEDDAEAHAALGWVELSDWDWRGAEHEFKRAVTLNPSLVVARVWYSQFLGAIGRHAEAREQSAIAVRLSPAAPEILTHAAVAAWGAGRVDEAIEKWREVVDLDASYLVPHHFLARGYLHQRSCVQAIAELQEAHRIEGDWRVPDLALLAYAQARCGNAPEARRIVSTLEARGGKVSAYHMALAYIGLGDIDRAFRWLESGYERRGEGLFFLNAEPLFEPLHSDPRYAGLIERIGLPASSLPKGAKVTSPARNSR